MTIAAHTDRTEQRPCSKCGVTVEHREVATMSCAPVDPFWRASPHLAPCGQRCFGGGATSETKPWPTMHGWGDRCPVCGPLRVLPEVVEEMRDRATLLSESPRPAVKRLASNLLRALDEIDKLRAELADTRKALGDAREHATGAEMMLALAEEKTSDDAFVLWAAMQAMVNDTHAPQDMLTKAQWAHAENLLVELDQRVNNSEDRLLLRSLHVDTAEVTVCEPVRAPILRCGNGRLLFTAGPG